MTEKQPTKDIEKERQMVARMARYLGCSGTHQDDKGRLLPCSSPDELNKISNRAEPKKKKEEPKRRKRGQRFEKLRERGVLGIETLPSGGLVSASVGKSAAPFIAGRLGRRVADQDLIEEILETKGQRKARSDRESATPAKPEERIQGSSKNPKGSARSTSSGSDIELTATIVASLAQKVAEHNKKMRAQNKPAHAMASLGALKSVWRRGAGAFSSSHRPGKSRQQWAMARVNAFLRILESGKPKNSRYTTDNDLLKEDHPWKKRDGKKTADVGLRLKIVPKIMEPFDNTAGDGDGDGKVQDGTRWERPAMAKNFFQGLWDGLRDPDGGFTLSLSDMSTEKSGWAIARAGHGIKLRADEIFDEDGNVTELGIDYLASFLDMNYEQFTEDVQSGRRVALGAWHNPEDGLIYFDVTDVYDKNAVSLEKAREIALKQNQISMADLDELHAAKADDDWDNHTPFHNTGGNGTNVADPKRFASFVRARRKQRQEIETAARERVRERMAQGELVPAEPPLDLMSERVARQLRKYFGNDFVVPRWADSVIDQKLNQYLQRGYSEDDAVKLAFEASKNRLEQAIRRRRSQPDPRRGVAISARTDQRMREGGPAEARAIDARRAAARAESETQSVDPIDQKKAEFDQFLADVREQRKQQLDRAFDEAYGGVEEPWSDASKGWPPPNLVESLANWDNADGPDNRQKANIKKFLVEANRVSFTGNNGVLFEAVPQKNPFVTNRGITVSGSIYAVGQNGKREEVGRFERTYKKDGSVYLDLLSIDNVDISNGRLIEYRDEDRDRTLVYADDGTEVPEGAITSRNSGFGVAYNNITNKWAGAAGFSQMDAMAGLDDGPYVWGRAGWRPKRSEDVTSLWQNIDKQVKNFESGSGKSIVASQEQADILKRLSEEAKSSNYNPDDSPAHMEAIFALEIGSNDSARKKQIAEYIKQDAGLADMSMVVRDLTEQESAARRQAASQITRPQVVRSNDNIDMLMAPGIEELRKRHGRTEQEREALSTMDWYAIRAMEPERRRRLAELYTQAPSPNGPNEMDAESIASYTALRNEIRDQFEALEFFFPELKIEFVDDDPYPDFLAMRNDFDRNNRLKILRTEVTGGHPFFTNEENDMFRAIHDLYGHLAIGRGFDRHGEEAAYQAHRTMFSEQAQRSLATELRAQNIFLIESGDFGPQKAVLMPEEFIKRLLLGLRSKADNAASMRKARADSDADNAYEKTRSHHVSGGRTLKNRVG